MSLQLTSSTVSRVPVNLLNLDFTLRDEPLNLEHVEILAGITGELPPILVHQPSRRVVDGIHRVHATLARGREYISAVMYDGSPEDAYAIAVRLNASHGLPLSRAERSSAARRILRTHPQWSNRMIAGMTGLSEATIRTRRHEVAEPGAGSATRLGQDGRVRPVNAAENRIRVSRLLTEQPTASARAIAKEAGVSTNTVLDVRRQLVDGHESAPARGRPEPPGRPAHGAPPGTPSGSVHPAPGGTQHTEVSLEMIGNLEKITETILGSLMADPSIRLSDRGRFLIRWMQVNRETLHSGARVVDAIPSHWSSPMAGLARAYAGLWQELARTLEHRAEHAFGPGTLADTEANQR
jgi:transposase